LFQILIDNSDINAFAALYVSIYIGITLKYLWALSVEYSFFGSLTNPANTKIIHQLFFYKKRCQLNGSFILRRIVKYIRRKACSQDDSEKPVSLLFY
jgi:hypothetical protein